MIVSLKSPGSASRRRPAFTLVEVLVVVAIVVILASVGTIATLKFLDDATNDNARMNASAVETAANSYQLKNPQWNPEADGLVGVTPYLAKGDAGLLDPWGNPYRAKLVPVQSSGNTSATPQYRIYVYTIRTNDNSNREFGSPKELEGNGGGVKTW